MKQYNGFQETVFEQHSILECFPKDHVSLKTDISIFCILIK